MSFPLSFTHSFTHSFTFTLIHRSSSERRVFPYLYPIILQFKWSWVIRTLFAAIQLFSPFSPLTESVILQSPPITRLSVSVPCNSIHIAICLLWSLPSHPLSPLWCFFSCFTLHIYPSHYFYPHKICNPIYFIIDVFKNASLGFCTITGCLKSRICITVSVGTELESELRTNGKKQ